MKLHIFNPDHEQALASDLDNFTAPKVVRKMQADLCFLPALWAVDGDGILVNNVEFAERAFSRVANRIVKYGGRVSRVTFVTPDMLHSIPIESVEPWGWNTTLRNFLIRKGVPTGAMPQLEKLSDIRLLSHRSTSARLLTMVKSEGMVGEMATCHDVEEIRQLVSKYGKAVLKTPWSCSGRGVRFVTPDILGGDNLKGWMRNMLVRQGSLMVEPYFNKVKDFGMEFEALPDGKVKYLGLSLFKTLNGAYTGNILATECAKEEAISRYVPNETLQLLKASVVDASTRILAGSYAGPFGVDMMIVGRNDRKGFLVHPCVEINLRRTMGHVALGISPEDDDIRKVMRISIGMNYVLKINGL